MPLKVSPEEFEKRARALLESVAAKGEVVLVERDRQPVAVLASHQSVMAMATTVDLPRWEGWTEEMRRSFPESGASPGRPAPAPASAVEVDKMLLGFDPGGAVVGSPAGREFLARELRRLEVGVTDKALLDTIYAALLELCEDKSRVYEQDLRVLAQEKIAEAPMRLRLLTLTVTSSSGLPATAEVTLDLGHGPAMRREHGDGPLDAAFNAIEKLTGLEPEVENFSVVAATKGRDAMAEAIIELELEGSSAVGKGASANTIEAGVHAYLNALNFLMEARKEPV